MFTIAVIGQKGGTGKTTVATAISVAAVNAGFDTVLLDLDPQANAANWKDRRAQDSPVVTTTPPARLRQTLQLAEQHGAAVAIIDTPGRQDSAAVDAARAADLVLIPTRPQIFEVETLAAMREMLLLAGDPDSYIVLNGLHPQARKGAEEAKTVIADSCGFRVCPVHLCQRRSYADAPLSGAVAQEIDPASAAAEEIAALFNFIRQQMKGKTNAKKQHGRIAKRA